MGTIATPSFATLLLKLFAGEGELGQATGFVVKSEGTPYLVTNWHVLSGRNPTSKKPTHSRGWTPATVQVWHNAERSQKVAEWRGVHEVLADDQGQPVWLEHPTRGSEVDVAVLPLKNTSAPIVLVPFEVPTTAEPPMDLVPGDHLNVVGFPFGKTVDGCYAIWTRASLASDYCVDFDGTPSFLVDARTRKGQSGSPVILSASPGQFVRMEGRPQAVGQPFHGLLGVYSGRLVSEAGPDDSSDLGRVWRARVITEIIAAGKRPSGVQ